MPSPLPCPCEFCTRLPVVDRRTRTHLLLPLALRHRSTGHVVRLVAKGVVVVHGGRQTSLGDGEEWQVRDEAGNVHPLSALHHRVLFSRPCPVVEYASPPLVAACLLLLSPPPFATTSAAAAATAPTTTPRKRKRDAAPSATAAPPPSTTVAPPPPPPPPPAGLVASPPSSSPSPPDPYATPAGYRSEPPAPHLLDFGNFAWMFSRRGKKRRMRDVSVLDWDYQFVQDCVFDQRSGVPRLVRATADVETVAGVVYPFHMCVFRHPNGDETLPIKVLGARRGRRPCR